MPVFSWFGWSRSGQNEQRAPVSESSPPDENQLETLARYIAESEQRWARQTARIAVMEEDGRDTSRSERVLRDLEETLAVLRQRHKCLELEDRSRRLLAAGRESLARSRRRTPTSPQRAA
jgi:hypothetical protein